MKPLHHGLTLLEVLAATVLLALMTVACAPLLQQAMRSLGMDRTASEAMRTDLARLFDTLSDPRRRGLSDLEQIIASGGGVVQWPAGFTVDSRPPVNVNVLRPASDAAIDHVWVILECPLPAESAFISRWVHAPSPRPNSEGKSER